MHEEMEISCNAFLDNEDNTIAAYLTFKELYYFKALVMDSAYQV